MVALNENIAGMTLRTHYTSVDMRQMNHSMATMSNASNSYFNPEHLMPFMR